MEEDHKKKKREKKQKRDKSSGMFCLILEAIVTEENTRKKKRCFRGSEVAAKPSSRESEEGASVPSYKNASSVYVRPSAQSGAAIHFCAPLEPSLLVRIVIRSCF